jgi:hypothetical protein
MISRLGRWIAAVVCLTLVTLVQPGTTRAAEAGSPVDAPAEGKADPSATIQRLEQRMEELQQQYLEEITELKKQLAALQSQVSAAEEQRQQDELEEILAEAEEINAEDVQRERLAKEQRKTFVGRERTLQALNPEISFLGDFSYNWSDGPIKNGFQIQGVEIGFQGPLDPYTRFKGFLAAHQHPFELHHHHDEDSEDEHEGTDAHEHDGDLGVNVEEAYMEWVALPFNSRLRVGKFRQQYGVLNRWHRHALPTLDRPLALDRIFGPEGLVGLGVGMDWLLPRLWASSNGLTLEITNAQNPYAFAGAEWRDPVLLLRHTGFFEFGPDAYFDLGLNWVYGPNDGSGDQNSSVAGFDFAYLWEPVNRARYRNFEIRGEYFHTRFENPDSSTLASDSFYLYVMSKLSRRWTFGVRYDNVELPFDRFELYHPEEFRPGLGEVAWTPFITYWQSEFVRLRLQYQNIQRDFVFPGGEKSDNRIWLQTTFAAGPHKHESY